MKQTLLKPCGDQHNELNNVAEGKTRTPIDLSKISENLLEGETEYDIAELMFSTESLQARSGWRKDLVVVNDPVRDESSGFLVVNHTLTATGQEALKALNSGVFWNNVDNCPDFQETIKFYNEQITRGKVETRFVDLLIAHKSEELTELRRHLVYFRMKGVRKDDYIVCGTDD
jgi:hypothetical protein